MRTPVKNCPFCGAEEESNAFVTTYDEADNAFIRCRNCGVCGPKVHGGDMLTAYRAWNRRVSPDGDEELDRVHWRRS